MIVNAMIQMNAIITNMKRHFASVLVLNLSNGSAACVSSIVNVIGIARTFEIVKKNVRRMQMDNTNVMREMYMSFYCLIVDCMNWMCELSFEIVLSRE